MMLVSSGAMRYTTSPPLSAPHFQFGRCLHVYSQRDCQWARAVLHNGRNESDYLRVPHLPLLRCGAPTLILVWDSPRTPCLARVPCDNSHPIFEQHACVREQLLHRPVLTALRQPAF